MSEKSVSTSVVLNSIVDNRDIGADGGPSVRVYGEVDDENVQLLRFDCFRKDPHYHYDPSGKNDQRSLNKESVPDSVAMDN